MKSLDSISPGVPEETDNSPTTIEFNHLWDAIMILKMHVKQLEHEVSMLKTQLRDVE